MPINYGRTEEGDIRLRPGYGGLLGEIEGLNFGLGPGKQAKKLYKGLFQGKDVSSFGAFNPIRQQAAAERSQISEDYLTGANALAAQAGGEQGNLLQRMKESALGESRKREAMATSAAIPQMMGQAADIWGQSAARRDQSRLAKYGLLGRLLGEGQYEKRPGFDWGGFLGGFGQSALRFI